MGKIEVECSDGKTEVSCINPLFRDIKSADPSITVAELEAVDMIFVKIKSMSLEQSNSCIQALGIGEMLRLKDISSKLKISLVLNATNSAIAAAFTKIQTPGDARMLFGVPNTFTQEQNRILLGTFAGVITSDASSSI